MRASMLIAVLAGIFAALSVQAQTVRVALVKGRVVETSGGAFAITTDTGVTTAQTEPSRFEAVGPFVSDGLGLSGFLDLRAISQTFRVNGMHPLGRVRVQAAGDLVAAVDEVALEEYVASVLGAEMGPTWPRAALEAQAVAVRTYVLKRMAGARGADWDVDATVLSQVYRGGASIDARTRAAAEATRGVVLKDGRGLADAWFFASCRGRTEASRPVFGATVTKLVPAACTGSERAPGFRWERRFDVATLSNLLKSRGILSGDLKSIRVAAHTGSGRIERVTLATKKGGRSLSGIELRQAIGYTELRSLDATIEMRGKQVLIRGAGAGHAVGLCQWCARSMAEKGAGRDEILRHFYPGLTIVEAAPVADREIAWKPSNG